MPGAHDGVVEVMPCEDVAIDAVDIEGIESSAAIAIGVVRLTAWAISVFVAANDFCGIG